MWLIKMQELVRDLHEFQRPVKVLLALNDRERIAKSKPVNGKLNIYNTYHSAAGPPQRSPLVLNVDDGVISVWLRRCTIVSFKRGPQGSSWQI